MVDVLVLPRVWRMCLPWCIELLDDVLPLLMLLSEPLIVEPVPVEPEPEPVPIVLPLGDIVESVAPDGLLIVPVPAPVPVEPEPVEPAVPEPVVCAAAAVAISAVAAITNIFMINLQTKDGGDAVGHGLDAP